MRMINMQVWNFFLPSPFFFSCFILYFLIFNIKSVFSFIDFCLYVFLFFIRFNFYPTQFDRQKSIAHLIRCLTLSKIFVKRTLCGLVSYKRFIVF